MTAINSPSPEGSSVSTRRGPDNLRGGLLLMLATVVLTLEAGIVRWLGTDAAVTQVVFFRAVAQFIVLGVWIIWKRRWPNLKSQHYGLHLARGILSVCTWGLYFRMFQKLDVSLATVLTFSTSLFVIVFAGPVMGERVRAVSWIATLAGFAGIAIAAGIGTAELSIEVVLGLTASAVAAFQIFLNRALAQTEDTVTIMTFIGFCVIAASTPLAYHFWQPISLMATGYLLIAGIFGALGMVLTIEAYAIGETAVLAPIPYTRIAFAIVLGYAAFGDLPSTATILGAAIVIASALWAMHAERKRGSAPE